MITEVDSPLKRSHYDWFLPDEGWVALFSAYLVHMRLKATTLAAHLETQREAQSVESVFL